MNTKTDYSINHVFTSTTIQELHTLHHISESERAHLLKILAMSVQNLHLAGFF